MGLQVIVSTFSEQKDAHYTPHPCRYADPDLINEVPVSGEVPHDHASYRQSDQGHELKRRNDEELVIRQT
jgi:hypothetical protein